MNTKGRIVLSLPLFRASVLFHLKLCSAETSKWGLKYTLTFRWRSSEQSWKEKLAPTRTQHKATKKSLRLSQKWKPLSWRKICPGRLCQFSQNSFAVSLPICVNWSTNSFSRCELLASWLAHLAEQAPRARVGPVFEPRTRTIFSSTEKHSFLRNPCEFPYSIVLQKGGCLFFLSCLYSTLQNSAELLCRTFLYILNDIYN